MNFTELLIAREKELGRPVKVGLAGAGQMGSGLAAQYTLSLHDALPI